MPIQSIDLKSIRYFIMSAELGSLRRAADSLKVRESTVSRRVRDLEDEIGASLFIRHPGGVSLTLAGQRFLHRARRAVEQLSAGAIEVHDIGRSQSGILRIGLFSSLTSGPSPADRRPMGPAVGRNHRDRRSGSGGTRSVVRPLVG